MAEQRRQRRGQRIPWVRPASLKLTKEQRRVLATTRDVSESGAYLVAESHIEAGTEIDLLFVLPPELAAKAQGWVRCQARVVRVETGGRRGEVGIAAEIKSFEALDKMPV